MELSKERKKIGNGCKVDAVEARWLQLATLLLKANWAFIFGV